MGDLNAVGPRAEGKMAFQERIKVIPGHESRLIVMPGMAGWGLMHGYEDVS
jgi:lipopolysaccharide/colanic/teichoic acid biosynthesis glycosyltransferase